MTLERISSRLLFNDGKSLYAYQFKGYWKDVGTIDSLWEANMDLLNPNNELDLNDRTWKIYTEDVTALPQYISADAVVKNAFITQGCVVEGERYRILSSSRSVKGRRGR